MFCGYGPEDPFDPGVRVLFQRNLQNTEVSTPRILSEGQDFLNMRLLTFQN